MHLKGEGGKSYFYTGGRMQFEQHTRCNPSPYHKQQLEKRQGCVSENAGLVTSAILDCVWGVEIVFHFQQDEIPPSARFGRHFETTESPS
uniref:Uncharacterized protein n=1 Tax=Arundo donax TaxID=35708 RepID=A0A0A8Y5T3_ARUDO